MRACGSSMQQARPIMPGEREGSSWKSKCDELWVGCWILRILVRCRTVCVTWVFVLCAEGHIHTGNSDVVEGFVVEASVVDGFS